jgi:type I restriction enzyme S subunit
MQQHDPRAPRLGQGTAGIRNGVEDIDRRIEWGVGGMRDSIPANWTRASIQDIATYVQRGKSPKYVAASSLPVINQKCIRWHGVDPQWLKFVHPDQWNKWSQERFLRDGDVLWNSTGTGTIGRAAVFRGIQGYDRAVVDSHVTIVRCAEYVPKLLHYWIMSPFIQAKIEGMQAGSTNQVELSKVEVLNTDIVVPPLQEQHRIVEAIESYLTRLDAAVALLERLQRNLKRYRASVLKAAVEGRLVPTEAELARKEGRSYEPASELLKRILVERRKKWIENAAEKARVKAEKKAHEAGKPWTHADDVKTLEKERAKATKKYKEPATPDLSALGAQAGTTNLPEGWCWAMLESLAVLITDGDHNPPKRVAEGVPHLTAKHVKGWRITSDGCSFVSEGGFERTRARYEPFAGDLIVTCVGTVGEAAIVPEGLVFSADRNLAGIRVVREGVVPEYLLFVLSSSTVQRLLHNLSGSTAQPHLYLGDLRKLLIPVPPKIEQERIAARAAEQVSCTERIVRDLDQARIRAVTLRQSILKWAFEGKLVEQDPNDLPAPRPGKHFVYALECDDGSIYIGQTHDILERWKQHASGKGAEWTKRHVPKKLVYWEEFDAMDAAVKREKELKTGFGRKWLRREIAAGRARQAGEPASVLLERIKAERESMEPQKRRRTGKRKNVNILNHDEQLNLLGERNT